MQSDSTEVAQNDWLHSMWISKVENKCEQFNILQALQKYRLDFR